MDEHFADLEQVVSASALLGYLNFSQGRPDPRWQKQLNEAYAALATRGAEAPWQSLHHWLGQRLTELQTTGSSAFRDTTQARAVLDLTFNALLPAYRRHHADLLAHQSDADLFQPLFLARALEAVLTQGPPWEEQERIVRGALQQLNDFVGYRPVAILETRPRGEPYEHERVRPIPLYLRGAGVAWGRYHDLVARALDILGNTDPGLLADAHLDLQLLDELALDPRAYDQGHPVNRRPNYIFGEWDPHHLDQQSRYRRLVARQVTLDALLERVTQAEERDRDELLFEAAAVLAGTLLMATGVSGSGPSAHDSSASLAKLMPGIARCREAFYAGLLQRLSGPHAERLRQEVATTRQPFGAARQHLNQYLARHRAVQLQQRHLALVFAEMGFPDASRREAGRIQVPSARLLSEILIRLSTGQLHLDRGERAAAAALLPDMEDLLHRGIDCGAFADPWNILGFQGLFPLSPAREDSVRDPRIEELLQVMQQLFSFHARLLSEAAAAGEQTLVGTGTQGLGRLATWWDRFASVEVSEVPRVHGGEAAASAEHVANALARWHERGEATADLAFWREHLEGFRSPKAFALVLDALLRQNDYRSSLALLVNWLAHQEQVPLEDGEHSFHNLALRWMLGLTGGESAPHPQPLSPAGSGEKNSWPLVQKFFDYLEANADDYWQVPSLGPEMLPMPRSADEEESLFSAAYEGVTFHDSADDDQEGEVADGGPTTEFLLESRGDYLARHLQFLATVAHLWMLAARQDAPLPSLAAWLETARTWEAGLLPLLDALHASPVPAPTGSQESLIEYDRRRLFKDHLIHQAINTCLEVTLAVGALHNAQSRSQPAAVDSTRPPWEPWALRLEQACLQGNPAEARAALPHFLEHFRQEPLLFVNLTDGGQPRAILRARIAQTIVRSLASALPRLGLLRETYHLLRTARAMEQGHPLGARGVTEFNQLFQTAFQGVLACVVASSADWPPPHADDATLVEALESLTRPFLTLWVEHSRTLQLSTMETLRGEPEWRALRGFIQRYGHDLFHAQFMTLGNLRGILHRSVGSFLDYLRDNPDPLRPVRLIEELEAGLPREPVERHLQFILKAVVENYEVYKDYKATTAQSDYGENLHQLLDFLRLRASYDRHAWQFRPLVLAHEVLARSGSTNAAVLWEEGCTRATERLAAEHLEALARLERTHGMRLATVADRLQERLVKPLALDRLCALVEPSMDEARQAGAPSSGPGGEETGSAFAELERELQPFVATPSGAGQDVPPWLGALQEEVQRVRAARSSLAVLADNLLDLPERNISFEELQQQLQEWQAERHPDRPGA